MVGINYKYVACMKWPLTLSLSHTHTVADITKVEKPIVMEFFVKFDGHKTHMNKQINTIRLVLDVIRLLEIETNGIINLHTQTYTHRTMCTIHGTVIANVLYDCQTTTNYVVGFFTSQLIQLDLKYLHLI